MQVGAHAMRKSSLVILHGKIRSLEGEVSSGNRR